MFLQGISEWHSWPLGRGCLPCLLCTGIWYLSHPWWCSPCNCVCLMECQSCGVEHNIPQWLPSGDTDVLMVLLHPDLSGTQVHVVCADICKPMLLFTGQRELGVFHGGMPTVFTLCLDCILQGHRLLMRLQCRFLQNIGTYLPVYMTFKKAARHC